jgi:hypothetical protein
VYFVATTTLSRWPFINSPREDSLVRVHVSCVDEVAPGLPKSVVNPASLVLGRTPAPVVAKRHGAERGFRNSKSAVSQKSVSHRSLLFIPAVNGRNERVIQPEKPVILAR